MSAAPIMVTQVLPTQRQAARQKALAETPPYYNEWVHLVFPSVVGLGLMAAAFLLVRDLRPLELLFIPAVLLFANANEWRIHKHILHRPSWPLKVLYYRHTPEHHVVYTEDDMAMRSTREFRLVLIPVYGSLAIFLVGLPITIGLWWMGWPNLACFWVASTMFYVVTYEWLHLSYHLPPDSWIGRRSLIRSLRRHHATHHRPELMQTWNFNVSLPLADWVMGTIWRAGGSR